MVEVGCNGNRDFQELNATSNFSQKISISIFWLAIAVFGEIFVVLVELVLKETEINVSSKWTLFEN